MVSTRSILGLVGLTAAFLFIVIARWSPDQFGRYHDDTLYWSSAQALAEGRGLLFPSIPGEPAPIKYPPLYPSLASLIWRVWPVFPDNLAAGFWVSALAGCAFLVGCFFLFRQLGLAEPVSLALTAACGLHPTTLILSSSLLSDMHFMALAVWAFVGAWAGLDPNGDTAPTSRRWWFAVAAVVLATATRSVGIAAALGIGAFAVFRGRISRGLIAAGCGIAFVGTSVLLSALQSDGAPDPSRAAAGFHQTILYYTSYVGFWKLSVPDFETFRAMAVFNLGELIRYPAAMTFFLEVVGFSGGLLLRVASVAVSIGIAKGLWTLVRSRGLHPAVFGLAATLPIVIVWNYPVVDRLLILFLPLFLAGAWTEMRFVGRSALEILRSDKPFLDRAIAGVLAALIAWLAGYGVLGYAKQIPGANQNVRRSAANFATERREAYDWIRENTQPGDRFVAYQDALLWLATGRQAIRPMIFSPEAFYRQDEEILHRDLEHFMDTAEAIGARYWLVTKNDFSLDSVQDGVLKHVERQTAGSVPIFVTQGGALKVFEIDRNAPQNPSVLPEENTRR